jgi:hypothetical protein
MGTHHRRVRPRRRFATIKFVPERESVEQLTRFATEVIPVARAAIAA